MGKPRIGTVLLALAASAMMLGGLATPAVAAPSGAAGGTALAARGGSGLQAAVRTGARPASGSTASTVYWKSFTWNGIAVGDCTMFRGATWTLYYDDAPNGQVWAKWDATVTSSANNDAWLMWARIQDVNRAELGLLNNSNIQNGADHREFIQNLPDHTRTYRWLADGYFDRSRFWLIANMSLDKHC